MISNKLTRIMAIIIIVADLMHSIIRIFMGIGWQSDSFLLIANVLLISVYFSLQYYIKGQEESVKCTNVFLLMAFIQVATVLLIFVGNRNIECIENIKGVFAFVLGALQIVITIYMGFRLIVCKDIPIKQLGIAFLIQGLLLLIILVFISMLKSKLLRESTIIMINTFTTLIVDLIEMFVVYYMYKVFRERFDDELF